ncbi:hypothetical protein [Williamsia sp. M5A3_1d]
MTTLHVAWAPRVSQVPDRRSVLARFLRPRRASTRLTDAERVEHQLRRRNRRELERAACRAAYDQLWFRR